MDSPEEAEAALVHKISSLTAAIVKLPSLSPSLEVNALFTNLVMACIPRSMMDVERLAPELQRMRASLIRLCADADALLEAHYSDLLATFDNPLDHLTLFPYFSNYLLLSQLEHALLAHHVLGPRRLRRLRPAPAQLPRARGTPPPYHRLRQLRHLRGCQRPGVPPLERRRRAHRAYGVPHLRRGRRH
ncbi:unnamed protein product [Miscanthus lutarioriparius]|uniref:Nicotianamine synthase n=1 Tax=Miscanthus lutarioriparius TaxID=422564 RepID=A0A811RI67_9POAL|nr:unnamed protein product [Miscanthus lutarioriparius]